MRLVSACYGGDCYPFNFLDGVDDITHTDEPDDLKKGDVLIVWGGGDIHPMLYGHERSITSQASQSGPSTRDRIEWNLMQQAKTLGLPIIGVCRGAQMLCALDGGYLIQHANGHSGHHVVRTYDNKTFQTNSIHHQMMVPRVTSNINMVAWTEPLSDKYHVKENDIEQKLPRGWLAKEPEFIHFKNVNGFAIQWHPEMTEYPNVGTEYVLSYIQENL